MALEGDAKREYQRRWMKARRDEYFNGKSCVRCGSQERLELDHIDPTLKVSHRVWSWAQARRDEELAKCQPLCHDCHKAKSDAGQAERFCLHGHDTWIVGRDRYTGGGSRCSECRREAHRELRRQGRKK